MEIGKDFIGVGVTGLLVKENKVLLLYRNKPPEKDCYGLIGGRIEFNEKYEDAVVREAKEEIGVDVKVVKMLNVVNQIIKKEQTHWVCINFLIDMVDENDKPKNIEPDVHKKMEWFDLNKLPKNITMSAKSALIDYVKFHDKSILNISN